MKKKQTLKVTLKPVWRLLIRVNIFSLTTASGPTFLSTNSEERSSFPHTPLPMCRKQHNVVSKGREAHTVTTKRYGFSIHFWYVTEGNKALCCLHCRKHEKNETSLIVGPNASSHCLHEQEMKGSAYPSSDFWALLRPFLAYAVWLMLASNCNCDQEPLYIVHYRQSSSPGFFPPFFLFVPLTLLFSDMRHLFMVTYQFLCSQTTLYLSRVKGSRNLRLNPSCSVRTVIIIYTAQQWRADIFQDMKLELSWGSLCNQQWGLGNYCCFLQWGCSSWDKVCEEFGVV